MELTRFHKKLIKRHIRKERRLSFKQRSILWASLSVFFSLILMINIPFIVASKPLYSNNILILIAVTLIISLALGSINQLFDLIKRYDDEFQLDVDKLE